MTIPLSIRPRRGRHVLRAARPLLADPAVERFPAAFFVIWTTVLVVSFVALVSTASGAWS